VEDAYGPGVMPLPGRSTFYTLIDALSTGRHTFGSAVTRRQTANRPDGVFTPTFAARPGEQVQIDSTPIDVLVLLESGMPVRADLTIAVDVASRTICAAVLRPVGTKAVDAALLLARMLVPEPMRPGWANALRMSASRLPHARLVDVDARMELAAAKPVIVPDTIVIDGGKVFVSETFTRACARLGVSVQNCRPGTPTDKGIVEATFDAINTLFCQHVAAYTGSNTQLRGDRVDAQAAWTIPDLQDLLDEWLLHDFTDRRNSDTGSELRLCIDYMSATTTRSCLPSLVWVVRVWHGFCLVRRPGLRAAMVHPFDLGESGQDDRNDLLRFARSNARYARLGRAIPLKVVTLVPVDVIRARSSLIAVLQPCHGWTPSPKSRRLRRSVRRRATG
jgi:transposase InsO family protein